MDVLTSETCWALNNEIKKQVTSSWFLFIHADSSSAVPYIVFTTARHLSLSWAWSIHAISFRPFTVRSVCVNITPHPHLGLPSCLLPSDFPTKTVHTFLFSPKKSATCLHQPHLPWLDHQNNIRWSSPCRLFSPVPCYLAPLSPTYLPHTPSASTNIRKHTYTVLCLYCNSTSFFLYTCNETPRGCPV